MLRKLRLRQKNGFSYKKHVSFMGFRIIFCQCCWCDCRLSICSKLLDTSNILKLKKIGLLLNPLTIGFFFAEIIYSGLTFEKQDSVSGGLSEILQIFPVKQHENL